MSETLLHIPKLSKIDEVFDKAMAPIMWMLGGFKRDSVQETHAWHVHPVFPEILNDDLIIEILGDDESTKEQRSPIDFSFHAPIFGGWKKYVVVGHDLQEFPNWHVGWHVIHKETRKTMFIQISKLKLKHPRVKLLKGTSKYITRLFAFTSDGKQIKLNLFDEGIHGDRKHKHLRLL